MTKLLAYFPSSDKQAKVLPKLLESIVSKNFKVHIACESPERVAELDGYLWTYEQLSFLPHATGNDNNLPENPIVLATDVEVKNAASVLIADDMCLPKNFADFEKIVFIVGDNSHDRFEGVKLIAQNKKLNIDCFVQTAKGWEKQKAI